MTQNKAPQNQRKRNQKTNKRGCPVQPTEKIETIFLTAPNLVYIKLNINGDDADALVDSGASVSVINQALVKCDEIIRRPVQLQSFDGKRQIYDEWVKANVSYQGRIANSDVLVVKGCDYKFLLSRPDMRTLKLNLYGNNKLAVLQETCAYLNGTDHLVKYENDVREKFPELLCLGNFQPATTKFTVRFKMRDVTSVRMKPCC